MNTKVVINPGTGPVSNANLDHATRNMQQFLVDCGLDGLSFERLPDRDDGGRFGFLIRKTGTSTTHDVEMPGIELERVRYLGEDGQNIWHYPRLYVDGSSWVWKFAIISEWELEDD